MRQLALSVFMLVVASIASGMHHNGEKKHDHTYGMKDAAEASIVIKKAWSPGVPPTANVRAGYFTLVNNTDKAITITGAKSPLFALVELHETQIKDGLMQMKVMKTLIVDAKSTVHFKPEGKHLMLMEATASEIPKMIPVMLMADTGEMFEVMLHVKEKEMYGHDKHKHHH